ncbi:MAG: hypothetical protein JXM73_25355 [Anaerolineae bacterium]|nr:hypothetical protein [Anaerolineae bacterium]
MIQPEEWTFTTWLLFMLAGWLIVAVPVALSNIWLPLRLTIVVGGLGGAVVLAAIQYITCRGGSHGS